MATKKKPNKQTKRQKILAPANDEKNGEKKCEVASLFFDVKEIDDIRFPRGKGYAVTVDRETMAVFASPKFAWGLAREMDGMKPQPQLLWLLEGEAFRIEREQEAIDASIEEVTKQMMA